MNLETEIFSRYYKQLTILLILDPQLVFVQPDFYLKSDCIRDWMKILNHPHPWESIGTMLYKILFTARDNERQWCQDIVQDIGYMEEEAKPSSPGELCLYFVNHLYIKILPM